MTEPGKDAEIKVNPEGGLGPHLEAGSHRKAKAAPQEPAEDDLARASSIGIRATLMSMLLTQYLWQNPIVTVAGAAVTIIAVKEALVFLDGQTLHEFLSETRRERTRSAGHKAHYGQNAL